MAEFVGKIMCMLRPALQPPDNDYLEPNFTDHPTLVEEQEERRKIYEAIYGRKLHFNLILKSLSILLCTAPAGTEEAHTECNVYLY